MRGGRMTLNKPNRPLPAHIRTIGLHSGTTDPTPACVPDPRKKIPASVWIHSAGVFL